MRKIKVLFVSHSAEKCGGAEDDFVRLLSHFSKKEQFEIYILSPDGARSKEYNKFSSENGIISNGFFPLLNENVVSYLKYFAKAFIQTIQVHRFIRRKKIDVCVFNVSVMLWPMIVIKVSKIKTIVFIREMISPWFLRKVYYRCLAKLTDYVFTVSDTLKNEYLNITGGSNATTLYSSAEKHVEKLSNEHSKSYFSSNNWEKLDSHKPHMKILSVGSISKIKNQLLILKAVKKILDRDCSFVPFVVFAGNQRRGTGYSRAIEDFIEQNRLAENVVFTGEIDKDKMYALYRDADCVVISSVSEGMPLVVSEAFSLGKPLISTKVGGVPEVIIDGLNGFLIDFEVEDLASKIEKIQTSMELREILSMNAMRSFEEHFNLQKNLEEIERIFYKMVIKKNIITGF